MLKQHFESETSKHIHNFINKLWKNMGMKTCVREIFPDKPERR